MFILVFCIQTLSADVRSGPQEETWKAMKHMNEIRKTVPVTQERTRVTLDLSNRLSAIVEDIAKDRGTTKADVVRMAIEFLAMANDASEEGMNVGAWKDDKENKSRHERVFGALASF